MSATTATPAALPMTSVQRNDMILFALTVFVRLAFHVFTNFVADDAFITFRFARNLGDGLGFVYNPGVPVLGSSTPLFTLILATAHLARAPLIESALFVSLLSSGLVAVLLYRLSLHLRLGWAAVLPALAYALTPRTLAADSCGMETALFTLFVVSAFYFQQRRLNIYAVGMATLATITRPEGLILLLIVMAHAIRRERQRLGSVLLLPLLLLLPWAVFATYYFGSPIPNSIPAKLALYSRFGSGSPLEHLVFIMGWNNPLGWLTVLAAVAGLFWIRHYQNYGTSALLWLLATILFYTFARTRLFFWYLSPIYPVLYLFAGAGLIAVQQYLAERTTSVRRLSSTTLTSVMSGLVIIVLLVAAVPKFKYYQTWQRTLEQVHREIGIYLHSMSEDNQIVAAEDIGYIGFYSQRRILDRDGLVSPEAIQYNREGRYLDLITDKQPEWVVASISSPISGFIDEPRFLERYQLHRRFSNGRETEYRLFQRIDSSDQTTPFLDEDSEGK